MSAGWVATVRGDTDNHGRRGPLADDARTLVRRFRRYEDDVDVSGFTVAVCVAADNSPDVSSSALSAQVAAGGATRVPILARRGARRSASGRHAAVRGWAFAVYPGFSGVDQAARRHP